jgi:hypothetical protein
MLLEKYWFIFIGEIPIFAHWFWIRIVYWWYYFWRIQISEYYFHHIHGNRNPVFSSTTSPIILRSTWIIFFPHLLHLVLLQPKFHCLGAFSCQAGISTHFFIYIDVVWFYEFLFLTTGFKQMMDCHLLNIMIL